MKKRNYTSAYVSISAILLSCIGAISVGFASWIISQGDATSVTGTINADNIDPKIAGLTINSSGPLTYSHYFFQNPNNTDEFNQDSATITYTIYFTGASGSLEFDGSLSFGTGLHVFNSTYISVKLGNEDLNHTFTTNNDAVKFSITATSTPQDLKFVISNKMIAKYGAEMNQKSFYLSLEAD